MHVIKTNAHTTKKASGGANENSQAGTQSINNARRFLRIPLTEFSRTHILDVLHIVVEKGADIFPAIFACDMLCKVPQAKSLEENKHRGSDQGESKDNEDAAHFAHINDILIELVEEESKANKRQRTDQSGNCRA